MDLSFIKEIDYKKHLNEDQQLIVENIGIDGLLQLQNKFNKMVIYFPEEPFNAMRREYAKKMKDKMTARDLARKLERSERWVYSCWNEGNDDNLNLFEEE
jgi:hypothetical protein